MGTRSTGGGRGGPKGTEGVAAHGKGQRGRARIGNLHGLSPEMQAVVKGVVAAEDKASALPPMVVRMMRPEEAPDFPYHAWVLPSAQTGIPVLVINPLYQDTVVMHDTMIHEIGHVREAQLMRSNPAGMSPDWDQAITGYERVFTQGGGTGGTPFEYARERFAESYRQWRADPAGFTDVDFPQIKAIFERNWSAR